MTNTVLIKRSSTANAVPQAGNLQAGELAINYNDGNLFYKNASNVVSVIASNKFTSVSGNVTGGNIVTSGIVTATGNITGNYFIGNGAFLTGIAGTYGNSDVANYLASGNVTTAIITTGNATVGNLSTGGSISAAGTVRGQNALTTSGFITADQSITGGSLLTGGYVSATGNVTAGNVLTGGSISAASTVTAAGITSSGVVNFVGTSNVSLGNLANVHISGGSANYVISTDGAGNLSWVAQTGGGGGSSTITVDDFTGNGVQTQFTLSVTPPDINSTTVNYNGVIQLRTGYSLSGANIVFSTAPANGSSIEVTTISSVSIGNITPAGSNTQVQFNDAGSLGASSAFTFNKSSNTLNATNVTANGVPLATTGKAIAMAIVFGF